MRISTLFVSLVVVFASACGGGPTPEDACDAYLSAAADCATEAGADSPITDEACAGYSGLTGVGASDAVDLLTCYADAIDAADCSDTLTVGANIASAVTSCI